MITENKLWRNINYCSRDAKSDFGGGGRQIATCLSLSPPIIGAGISNPPPTARKFLYETDGYTG